jgi:hypothetical protein
LKLFADIVWEEKIIKKLENCVKTRQNDSRRKNKRQDMTRQEYMRQDSDTPKNGQTEFDRVPTLG